MIDVDRAIATLERSRVRRLVDDEVRRLLRRERLKEEAEILFPFASEGFRAEWVRMHE